GILGVNGSQYRSSYGFGQSVPAISIAIQRARDEHLIDNVNFTFTWLICDCDPLLSVGSANQLILNENVDVIIGPPCVAIDAGLSAGFYNMPIFVWGATISAILNDDSIYPTLTNINSNTQFLAKAVEAVLMQFQWYEISFVYIPDDVRRVGLFFPQDFQNVMNENPNLTIVFNQQMDDTPESMQYALLQISNRSRIVVVTIDSNVARRNFLLTITDMGFAQSNEYVFILPQLRNLGMLQQGVSSTSSNVSKYNNFWMSPNGVSDGRDEDALKAARRVINIDLENMSSSQIDAFNAKMVDEFGKPPFNCINECMGGPNDHIPSSYARSLHDTTYAYLRTLNLTTEKFGYLNKDLVRNGTFINNISKGVFNGQTGQVVLDENGNRQPNFFVNILDASDQATVVMNISVVAGVAIRQLDHDNLNKFCGLCIDAPILYSIWKHCQRGSLKDVIAKERYVGDSFVMFTLMRDITNGLIALHQSFICAHGMLSSENCLINDRWQVKISDFGLNMIRESQPITKKKLLWTAPELLRENNRKGTKEGDIYSFAIICCELINRETVWNGVEREDDVDEIIYRLRRTNTAISHRPQIHPREEINQNLVTISIAIQRARDEHLIDNVNFTFTWLICDCDPIFSVGSANQLILNENVDVIIGPPCAATYAGLSAGFYNMPIFVWGAAVSSILNDYPTLTNINSNTKFLMSPQIPLPIYFCTNRIRNNFIIINKLYLLAKAVEAVLMQFQWYEISFVYIPDNIRRVGLYFPQDFQSVMVLNPNLTIVFNQQMDDTPESMHNTLLQISNRSRIVVVTIDALEARRNFLLAITDMGFAQSNEYVFIIVQLRNIGMSQQVSSNGSNVSKYNNFWMTTNGINDGRDDDALKAARRVIIPSLYSRSLHDTTYAYLKALNSTSEKFGYLNKNLVRNGTIINNMSRSIFNEIFYRLKRSNVSFPHRPQLHQREDVNNNLLLLIRDCWSENPSERPKMDMVKTMLKQMVNDGNQNLMDYVFGMLEQYASSLEQEVEERTRELVEEKKKSDILLYRMLPKQVADKLKLGEFVEPEQFSAATIFFSDVVSFTTLASKCSPLQFVLVFLVKMEMIILKKLLNYLLLFLRTVSTFRVDHLPNERVNLRIGFHTGPAVAGVVGLTMPRYCLFGDTVNTASRMESNGKPGRIHISNTSNHYLTNIIGGYVTEPRGEVIIKGKGVMETFWLLGHSGDINQFNGLRENSPEP
ncbi:Guanylate cyclase, partial [Meloidogyne graminicola]